MTTDPQLNLPDDFDYGTILESIEVMGADRAFEAMKELIAEGGCSLPQMAELYIYLATNAGNPEPLAFDQLTRDILSSSLVIVIGLLSKAMKE